MLTQISGGLGRPSCSDGRIDPLTALHQSAEYQQHLAGLIELVASPALQTLRTERVQAQWRQQQARDLRDLMHHRAHAGIHNTYVLNLDSQMFLPEPNLQDRQTASCCDIFKPAILQNLKEMSCAAHKVSG